MWWCVRRCVVAVLCGIVCDLGLRAERCYGLAVTPYHLPKATKNLRFVLTHRRVRHRRGDSTREITMGESSKVKGYLLYTAPLVFMCNCVDYTRGSSAISCCREYMTRCTMRAVACWASFFMSHNRTRHPRARATTNTQIRYDSESESHTTFLLAWALALAN
jgi:hypothetical protein